VGGVLYAHDALPVAVLDRISTGTIFISINVPTPTPTAGGGELWAVRGTPADGSFLSGRVERSRGMADVERHAGIVVEDAGVPGTRGRRTG
jgi:hypothetical protein